MTFDEVRNAIYDWAQPVLGVPVFWTDQNLREDEIVYPYATITLDSEQEIGRDYKSRPDSTGTSRIAGNLESILRVQYFSNEAGAHPVASLQTLLKSINKRATKNQLNTLGIVVLSQDNVIRDISNIFGSRNERRAATSFIIRYAFTDTDTGVGVIEDVFVNASAEHANGDSVPVDITIETTP